MLTICCLICNGPPDISERVLPVLLILVIKRAALPSLLCLLVVLCWLVSCPTISSLKMTSLVYSYVQIEHYTNTDKISDYLCRNARLTNDVIRLSMYDGFCV